MHAVRQSWVNRPLDEDETAQLQSVALHAGHLAPALHLIVHDLQLSASQLGFMQNHDMVMPNVNPVYLTAYRQDRVGRAATNRHLALTSGEEQHVLGQLPVLPAIAKWKKPGNFRPITVPPCSINVDIAGLEQQLTHLVMYGPTPSGVPRYPLSPSGTPLERDMHADLEASWIAHHTLPVAQHVHQSTPTVVQELKVRAGMTLGLSLYWCCVNLTVYRRRVMLLLHEWVTMHHAHEPWHFVGQ
jgi:hypothetical protein